MPVMDTQTPDPRRPPAPYPVPPRGAQPYPQPGYRPYAAPPTPPKKSANLPAWLIVVIAVGCAMVLLLVGIVGSLVLDNIGGDSTAKPTARMTGCTSDGLSTTIDYVLTNHDSRTHTYYVHGTVNHSPAIPDVKENVAPGETVTGQIIGLGLDGGSCEITEVDQR